MTAWTRAKIEALGPTTDVPTLASICGVNKDTVYAQIRRGEWTGTRVLPLGRKLRIPVQDVLNLLYPPPPDQAQPAAPATAHLEQHHTGPYPPPCGCHPAPAAVIPLHAPCPAALAQR